MKIPTRIVGDRIYIHGIVHDSLNFEVPRYYIENIREKLKNEKVICEDGFCAWLPHAVPFRETEHFNLGNISLVDRLRIFKRIVLKGRKHMIQDGVREMLFETYPSEPEGMNLAIARVGAGSLEDPQGEFPFSVRRYIYEAKEILKYSQECNPEVLHIVVGCRHELPLEYLLSNPHLLD